MTMSVFRSSILDADGKTVNVGYLSLYWIMIVVLNVIPLMCGLSVWAVAHGTPVVEVLKALGIGVAAVTGAFATALAALGAFIAGDSRAYRTAPLPAQTSVNPQVD